MEIESIIEVKSYLVSLTSGEWTEYRRHSADNWEVLMGESWEPVYNCVEIEMTFQKCLDDRIRNFNFL